MASYTTLKIFQRKLLPIFNYQRKVESNLEQKPNRSKIHILELDEALKTETFALFKEHIVAQLNTQ